jgi:hypothetical protein
MSGPPIGPHNSMAEPIHDARQGQLALRPAPR